MRQVFIVGVNHCWQQLAGSSIGQPSVEDPRTGWPREITVREFADFDRFIKQTTRERSIATIVEEACGSPHERIATLAAELNIPHKYCELPKTERVRRGIKTITDREKHWLSVLESVERFPVLV